MYQEWFKEYERIRKGLKKKLKVNMKNDEWKKFEYHIIFKNHTELKGTIDGTLKGVIDLFTNGKVNISEDGGKINYYDAKEILIFELKEIK